MADDEENIVVGSSVGNIKTEFRFKTSIPGISGYRHIFFEEIDGLTGYKSGYQ
jgi:hypothetical protein